MGSKTSISWCDFTFNPWHGCQKVSPGCDRCYAMTLVERLGWVDGGADGKYRIWGPPKTTLRRLFGAKHWSEPLRWNQQAEQAGERRRVFCASMADVFEDHPGVGSDRLQLWQLISSTPMLDWLLLTKRPENVREMVPSHWWSNGFPKNVWLGTSVETQQYAAIRIPILLRLPAAVRFLSCEPLLGPLDLRPWLTPLGMAVNGRVAIECEHGYDACPECDSGPPLIQWVIAGGESGAGHRPMSVHWVESLRDQCVNA